MESNPAKRNLEVLVNRVMTSLLSTISWEREMETGMLSSSAWDPVTRCMGVAPSCMRRGLDWTLGNTSPSRGWSNSEIIFLDS